MTLVSFLKARLYSLLDVSTGFRALGGIWEDVWGSGSETGDVAVAAIGSVTLGFKFEAAVVSVVVSTDDTVGLVNLEDWPVVFADFCVLKALLAKLGLCRIWQAATLSTPALAEA